MKPDLQALSQDRIDLPSPAAGFSALARDPWNTEAAEEKLARETGRAKSRGGAGV